MATGLGGSTRGGPGAPRAGGRAPRAPPPPPQTSPAGRREPHPPGAHGAARPPPPGPHAQALLVHVRRSRFRAVRLLLLAGQDRRAVRAVHQPEELTLSCVLVCPRA